MKSNRPRSDPYTHNVSVNCFSRKHESGRILAADLFNALNRSAMDRYIGLYSNTVIDTLAVDGWTADGSPVSSSLYQM